MPFLHVEKVVKKPGEKNCRFPVVCMLKKSEKPHCWDNEIINKWNVFVCNNFPFFSSASI